MNIYKCPKCETEFSLGTKFCESCACNLEVGFIEASTARVANDQWQAGDEVRLFMFPTGASNFSSNV